MPFNDVYRHQVQLLVRALPYVADEGCFALKGGTAINLFVRDMPRLSVDIDLTYLPLGAREESLVKIDAALKRIGERIKSVEPAMAITQSAPASQDTINKIVIRTPNRVQIKIEVTPVLRGCVYDPVMMRVSERAEDEFGFAEINVLSFADLYAGKIMAALDRQHPRDLYDLHQLQENEGITDELRAALIVYLISHNHPPHQLLSTPCRNLTHDYEHSFRGMTEDDISISTLTRTHANLLTDLVANMVDDHKQFLLSFYRREPKWALLGLEGIDQLPAVRWREQNLDRAGEGTRRALVQKLERVLLS